MLYLQDSNNMAVAMDAFRHREMHDNNEKLDRFQACLFKLKNLEYRKDERHQDELHRILDDLNALDYNSKFADEGDVSTLLVQCCRLTSLKNEELLQKFSWLTLNTLNRQKMVLVHGLDTLMEYILRALRHCSPKTASLLLRALATVVYENAGKTAKFHEDLLGDSGILCHLMEVPDLDIRRAAIQCLENLTLRSASDAVYLAENHQLMCVQCFLKTLQVPAPSGLFDGVQCKILISTFKGLQNLVAGRKSFPAEFTGSVLAALQVYTVYGQPGAPAVVPTSLTSVPLAQYDTQAPAHDTNKDKLPATDDKTTGVKSNQASKKKNKRTRNRNKKTPGEVRGDQDENDDALEPESSAQSAEMDALATGGPAFWASLGSSDSDYSDTEGGSSSKLPSIASRVRVCALACFHALIKVVERRIMFGYWPSFIPDANDAIAVTTKLTLFTVILKDPSHKVRCAALGVLNALLDGSKQYLMAAEDADQYRNAPFTTFYVTVGNMIKEIHRCLLLLLGSEPSAIVITQVIKCLGTLVANVAYQRLKPGLLSRVVRQIQPYLSHRDPNIRVACLTCLGNVVSVHAPMVEVEVYHLLVPQRPNARLSEHDNRTAAAGPDDSSNGDHCSDSSMAHVSRESGYSSSVGGRFSSGIVTPVLTSGLQTPSLLEPGFTGELETSWIVRHCLRNVAPFLLDRTRTESLEGSLTSTNHPLPVRLESLQLLAQIAKGYFIVLRPHLEVMRDLVSLCLRNQDTSVQLHGAKLLDAIGGTILHLNQQPNSSISVSPEQALDLWLPLLNGPIQSVLHDHSIQTVKATICDCLSNIGPGIFEKLPKDKRILCMTLLLGLAGDDDHHVKAAATRALGCYIVYPCLREDVSFVADTANVLILAASEPNLSVRWRAAWSLSNLSDALLLNKTDGNEEFDESFSQLLLIKLFETAIKLCTDNEKARSNGVRTVGNLLRYLPDKYCAGGRFHQVIDDSVLMIVKNITTGTVKVRWNASYAVGNILRNESLRRNLAPHLAGIFSALMTSIKSCKNFKVRISATSALSVPNKRIVYGDLYVGVWDDLVGVLAALEEAADFSEFQYQQNLKDQIMKTLMHLTTLVMEDDLELLLDRVLAPKRVVLSQNCERFYTESVNEKSVIPLPDVKCHLELLKSMEKPLTKHQLEAITLLENSFTVPESDESSTLGFEEEHVPLSSGFRMTYD